MSSPLAPWFQVIVTITKSDGYTYGYGVRVDESDEAVQQARDACTEFADGLKDTLCKRFPLRDEVKR